MSSDSTVTPVSPVAPVTPITPLPDAIPPVDALPPIGGIEGVATATTAKQITNKLARPWFLPADNSSDPMKARGAARDINTITPIIDGTSIFRELEDAVDAAEKSVLLAFWAFDPSTKMVSDSGRNWMDMLLEAANRGVKVRIFWNDFDAGLQSENHTAAWFRYLVMTKQAAKLGVSIDTFQVVVSHHEAETAASLMDTVRHDLYDNLVKEINKKTDKERELYFQLSPGFWDKINFDLKSKNLSVKSAHTPYPAWPAAHHQKIAIIDGKFAYTGGVNITDGYIASSKHDKAFTGPVGPWHDAFVKAEGSDIIADFISNYAGLWNQERTHMNAFLTNAFAKINIPANQSAIRSSTDMKLSDFPVAPPPAKTTAAPALPCQVRRTTTVKGSSPFGTPQVIRKDILEGYLLAISLAEQYIYIENQYFREKQIADAIIAQHKSRSDLRTILLIPKISEELLRGSADEITKHGAALQFENFDNMTKSIGNKLSIFSMEQPGGGIIYVHSKLMLIDDKFGSIGSANSNPRSYSMDTELDLVWYDEKIVTALRKKLWNEILGNPGGMDGWKSTDYVKKWQELADKNKRSKPAKRKGFVVPFVNDAKGAKSSWPLDPFT